MDEPKQEARVGTLEEAAPNRKQRRAEKSISMKMNRRGEITIKSHGGVDLRPIVEALAGGKKE